MSFENKEDKLDRIDYQTLLVVFQKYWYCRLKNEKHKNMSENNRVIVIIVNFRN